VADAGISTRGIGGGRLIPLVILDTSDRPDIEEFIRVHQTAVNLGDCTAQWGQIEGHEGTVALFLMFIRPSEVTIILEFNIAKEGILVDQALFGKGLYIQAGREGDRLIKDPHRPKVLLHVGDTGFEKTWDALWPKHLEKHLRTKGLAKSDARRAARTAIEEMWWLILFPGLAIFFTVLAYNLIGEGLQEATDPRLRQSAH
jgi:hypothetical protein